MGNHTKNKKTIKINTGSGESNISITILFRTTYVQGENSKKMLVDTVLTKH